MPAGSTEKALLFYDVWGLLNGLDATTYALLKNQNDTAQSTMYWEDDGSTKGMMNYVNGLARVIKYKKVVSTGQGLYINSLWEGEVALGYLNGIGRFINTLASDQFIGLLKK